MLRSYLYSALLAVLAVFAPVHGMLLSALALVGVNLVTGLACALRVLRIV